jgi:hypothetical protein
MTQNNELTGTWRLDPGDIEALGSYGNVTLRFQPNGILLYTIHESDRDQIIRLKFQVEPGFIVTDQPSEPRREKTPYEFTSDGKLVLHFGGEKSRYIRVT